MLHEKSRVLFHRRFHFLHASNFRPARTFPQESGEFGKLCLSSHGVHLNAPVIDIAHPASETDPRCRLLDEVAKTHSLHLPSHVK